MKQLKKTLLTLVALLALTAHAWADDKKVVLKVDPITVANGSEAEIKVKMDYTAEKTLVGLSFSLYLPDGILLKGFNTKEAQDAAKASALMKAFDINFTTGLWGNEEAASGWFSVKQKTDGGLQITLIDQDEKTAFVNTHAPVISVYVHAVADVSNVNGTINGITLTDNANNSVEQGNIADVLIPFNATAQEPESSVPITWDATSKTATLTNGMPAGNVTVSVEYFPQATMLDGAVTAATDVKATTEDALVTIDKSKLTGVAKLMYFVSTDAEATAPAYTAEGWTDVLPTAENYTEAAELKVWYYAVGADNEDPDKTYSDGDICAAPLTVTLGAAPLWNAEFDLTDAPAEDQAPGVWKTDITGDGVKKGTPVTVTYTGTKKVIGVKAEKKAAPKLLEFEPMGVKFYYYEGETWGEAIRNHPENAANGWYIEEFGITVMYGGRALCDSAHDDDITKDTVVNPNGGYLWGPEP